MNHMIIQVHGKITGALLITVKKKHSLLHLKHNRQSQTKTHNRKQGTTRNTTIFE